MRPTKNMQRNAAAAMPEIQVLVKKHGLDVIAYCVARFKENQKRLREIETLRHQIATIEKKIS